MDTDRITEELSRRFGALPGAFRRRRIIFWHDEEREFAKYVEDLHIEGVKILALTGSNFFAAKKQLLIDDPESNYLVYCPLTFENPEDNWLIDIELYSEEFRADLVSLQLEDMTLPNVPELRRFVKEHRKFFASRERRKLIAGMPGNITGYAGLELCVMSAVCGLKASDSGKVIMSVLKSCCGNDDALRELVHYGLDGAFWDMAESLTGYDGDSDSRSLAVHVLMSASDHVMGKGGNAWCYGLVSEWQKAGDIEEFRRVAEYAEDEEGLPEKFMSFGADELSRNNIFPCVDYVILEKLMTDIAGNIIDAAVILRCAEERRLCVWHEGVKWYYGGLVQVAYMQKFYGEHSEGFRLSGAREIWRRYTEDYYRMDTYYRKFHRCFAESLKHDGALSDMFKSVAERAEGLYVSWYLSGLGSCWCDSCREYMRDYGGIPGVRSQEEFYGEQVANEPGRIYVIISDAMRYEVAVSLAEELEHDTKCRIRVKSVQGIFPTTTKYGMAALLPHRKLAVERKGKNLAVLADGMSTESPDREKVLKARNPKSVALKYTDIAAMKRADRQSCVKGMEVVYIYHSTIDDAGHMGRSVCTACDEAIEEIKNMVRIIANDFGGTRITITADHGFLYTYSPLREYDMLGITGTGQEVETGRRYAVMTAGSRPDMLLPVKFLDGDSGYDGFAPADNIRIKVRGSEKNFVHGGISLQELVVPVIEYHYLRNDSREYRLNRSRYDMKPVELGLLSPERRVSAMTFALNFYQKDAVSSNREGAVYTLCFADDCGNAVSDTVKVIADRRSRNAQDRVFMCTFRLKAGEYDGRGIYYLVMLNEDGEEVMRSEFQINIC